MIDTHINHPSIVMWVLFNEGWGQFDTERMTELDSKARSDAAGDCASGWTDGPSATCTTCTSIPARPRRNPRSTARPCWASSAAWACRSTATPGKATRTGATRAFDRRRAAHARTARGDPSGPSADRLAGPVRRRLHADDRRRNRSQRPDDLRPGDHQARHRATGRQPVGQLLSAAAADQTARGHAKPSRRTWRYTTEKPADDWNKPDFDDATWQNGPGRLRQRGHARGQSPHPLEHRRHLAPPRVRTAASSGRRTGAAASITTRTPRSISTACSAVELSGYQTADYESLPLDAKAAAALQAGKNMLAVHCHQTSGGQYIDVGLDEI